MTVILFERKSKCRNRCKGRNASLGIWWILLSPKRKYWRFSANYPVNRINIINFVRHLILIKKKKTNIFVVFRQYFDFASFTLLRPKVLNPLSLSQCKKCAQNVLPQRSDRKYSNWSPKFKYTHTHKTLHTHKYALEKRVYLKSFCSKKDNTKNLIVRKSFHGRSHAGKYHWNI